MGVVVEGKMLTSVVWVGEITTLGFACGMI